MSCFLFYFEGFPLGGEWGTNDPGAMQAHSIIKGQNKSGSKASHERIKDHYLVSALYPQDQVCCEGVSENWTEVS